MAKAKTTSKKTASAAKTTKAATKATAKENAAPVIETAASVEAPNIVIAKKSTTVTVMYRNPTGLRFRIKDKIGEVHSVTINGYGESLRGLEKGILVPGWGLTHNVDAELWAAVEEQYAKVHPAFTRGFIKAFPDAASAESEAENRREMKSSLDPVNPENTQTAGV